MLRRGGRSGQTLARRGQRTKEPRENGKMCSHVFACLAGERRTSTVQLLRDLANTLKSTSTTRFEATAPSEPESFHVMSCKAHTPRPLKHPSILARKVGGGRGGSRLELVGGPMLLVRALAGVAGYV